MMIKDGVTFSESGGSGNATITISADSNEGIDVTIPFRVSAGGITKDISILREGRREVFTDNDFILSDGGTFNVIKNGLQ